MTEDEYRDAVREAFATDMSEHAVALLKAGARLGKLGEDLTVLTVDSLLDACDGTGTPDVDGMVDIWNALVRVREELDAAQARWKRLDQAAQHWTTVNHKPFFNALSRITEEVDR